MGKHNNNKNQGHEPTQGTGTGNAPPASANDPAGTGQTPPPIDTPDEDAPKGAGTDEDHNENDQNGDDKPPEILGQDIKPPINGKRRIRNPNRKGTKLTIGAKIVEFDAKGIVELDSVQADILLSIPGYEEVKQE
jgi:hypothetical protein